MAFPQHLFDAFRRIQDCALLTSGEITKKTLEEFEGLLNQAQPSTEHERSMRDGYITLLRQASEAFQLFLSMCPRAKPACLWTNSVTITKVLGLPRGVDLTFDRASSVYRVTFASAREGEVKEPHTRARSPRPTQRKPQVRKVAPPKRFISTPHTRGRRGGGRGGGRFRGGRGRQPYGKRQNESMVNHNAFDALGDSSDNETDDVATDAMELFQGITETGLPPVSRSMSWADMDAEARAQEAEEEPTEDQQDAEEDADGNDDNDNAAEEEPTEEQQQTEEDADNDDNAEEEQQAEKDADNDDNAAEEPTEDQQQAEEDAEEDADGNDNAAEDQQQG